MNPRIDSPMPLVKCSPGDIAHIRSGIARHGARQAGEAAHRKWISKRFHGRRTIFCTFTAKEFIDRKHCIEYLTREILERELHRLSNRYQNAVSGRCRRGKIRVVKMEWEAVVEGGINKLFHAHIIAEIPDGWSIERFQTVLEKAWKKSEWAQEKSDFRPIYDVSGLAGYLSKEIYTRAYI